MSNYKTYLKVGHEYQPFSESSTVQKLPAGMYTIKYDSRTEMLIFAEFHTTHDELINLPKTAYDDVIKDLTYYFTEECQDRFKDVSLLPKMNILLYGVPGGGKTCIVNRVAHKMVEEGGIVLFNPNPQAINETFRILNMLQPDSPVLVIFEELDQLIDHHGEVVLLNVLDGELQKRNAMFIATTNFIDEIPKRVRRPGRFPIRTEVGLPNLEARKYYCDLKLKDSELATKIAEMTHNFNIDQLKDVIRAHYCMKKPLNSVILDLRKEFNIPSEGRLIATDSSSEDLDSDWADDDDEDDSVSVTPVILGRSKGNMKKE